ncbi:histidine ammonia-lyase [Aliivibrio fischeri]|uniref:histidine ammonia-lyase n=1 Tax=Aliivibrio fischeri TaxID=668 RepID=UPI0037366B6D
MFKLKPICIALGLSLTLVGCKEDSSSTSKPTPSATKVNVYSSIDNCATAADVPNCHFENGVYILKMGNVTDIQQQAVITQVNNFLTWAHDDVRKQFSQKRVIVGITETEPDGSGLHDDFIMALADNLNNGNNIDAIELVYSALNDGGTVIDETTQETTYQKLMQMFDYYVDGNLNTQVGAELLASYEGFKFILNTMPTTIRFDECNYGNGQLSTDPNQRIKGTPSDCGTDDGDPVPNGKLDPVHELPSNLNPGALLGTIYEYKVKPSNQKSAGEITTTSGTFTAAGDVASDDVNSVGYPNNWANGAFTPLNDYLETYFFVNKK